MESRVIDEALIREYVAWLYQCEKSNATIRKYQHYLVCFRDYLGGEPVCKDRVIRWKEKMKACWSPITINGALAALNELFRFKGWGDCTVKFLKVSRRVFGREERELSKEEYKRMVEAAENSGNERMALLLQTVCVTGIRISELSYITVEALTCGRAEVACKGKVRTILLPGDLCRLLKQYARKRNIQSGMIFVTRTDHPMDRSNIWREMKKLAKAAQVEPEKAFPHNLRHLFARTFYSREKDLLRLADILGHSNINTTRIYTMENDKKYVRQLEGLGLVVSKYNGIPLLL